ncbi:MAG TPA: hypothetical protein VHW65_03695 [Gemmatimonadales bacterium]|jgi:uncharacterized membrane protein|nr:hypothetical protein [Gemmatimonadales bacterium]
MHPPDWLLQLFGPWKELYSNSKLTDTVTVFFHLAALLFGGGAAIVVDRATLRVRDRGGPGAERALADIHASHRLVLIALSVLFISGIALAGADLETFFASPIFWVKLSCVTLLVANGALLTSTERRLRRDGLDSQPAERLWRRLRFSAVASLVLWTMTVLVGTALANMV